MADLQCRHQTVAAVALFQIIMGAVTLLAGVLIVTKKSWTMGLYHGIAAGAWICVSGLVGTIGGCTKSKGMIITFLLLSILSMTVIAGGMVVLSYFGYIADNIYSLNELVNGFTNEEKLDCVAKASGSLEESKEGYVNCPNSTGALMNLIVCGMGAGLILVGMLSVIFSSCLVCDCCIEPEPKEIKRRSAAKVRPKPQNLPTLVQPAPMLMGQYRPLKGHYGFTQQQISKARQLFVKLDVNRDGTISQKELGTLVRSFGFVATEDELKQLHMEVDRNKDGKIEFEELILWLASSREESFTPEDIDMINLMRQKYYPLQKEMIFDILRTFKEYDISGDNVLSVQELNAAIPKMGIFIHPMHLQNLHKTIDENGDGVVDFEEFVRFTLNTSKM